MSGFPPGGTGPPPPGGDPSPWTRPAPPGPPAPWGAPPSHSYAPAPPDRQRGLRGLATALLVLLCVAAVVDLSGAVALFNRSSMLSDAADGEFVSNSDADAADTAVTVTVVLSVLLYLAIAVVFIIWQYRHAKNAEALRGNRGLGAGWAIGGWFIPVANLILPGIQLFQAGRASDPALVGAPPDRTGRGPGIVVAWAVLFGIALVMQGVANGLYPTDGSFATSADIDAAAASDGVGGLALLLYVAAAVVCILMVRSLTARQELAFRASAVQSHAYGPDPWTQQPVWNAPAQPWAGERPTPTHPEHAPDRPEAPPDRPAPTNPWELPPR